MRDSHYSAYEAHLATAPQHIPTQHDMLPQHLVWKYELNCEYCNITLARNRAPWWWSDKIETCRSVLKCFKSVLCEIICAFVGWWIDSAKNAQCYNKIYTKIIIRLNYTHYTYQFAITIGRWDPRIFAKQVESTMGGGRGREIRARDVVTDPVPKIRDITWINLLWVSGKNRPAACKLNTPYWQQDSCFRRLWLSVSCVTCTAPKNDLSWWERYSFPKVETASLAHFTIAVRNRRHK